MGPKRMMHAGEAGLTSVVEGMAKVREALPYGIREAADRRLGGDSALGKGVRAMVDTVAEESAKARASRAALAVEAAGAMTAAAAAAEEKALAMVEAADTSAKSGGRGGKVLLAGLALGAAAGGAYLVWKRRQQAARDHLSGEAQWAPAGGSAVSDLSARVSAEADEASEGDQVSDVVEVSEVVEDAEQGVDTASELAGEASEAAGDTDGVPRSFNEQIDAVADAMSADVVDAIETPDGGGKGN